MEIFSSCLDPEYVCSYGGCLHQCEGSDSSPGAAAWHCSQHRAGPGQAATSLEEDRPCGASETPRPLLRGQEHRHQRDQVLALLETIILKILNSLIYFKCIQSSKLTLY